MALTRSALREKGITEKEILDYIMDEHGNTVEAAKEKAKETAEAAAKITIDKLQAKVDSKQPADGGEDWKAKYDAEVIAHTATKTTYETEKTTAVRTSLAEKKLIEAGCNPKAVKFILKELPLDKLKDDGSNWDELHKPIQEANADFYGETQTKGVDTSNPPAGQDGKPDPFLEGFNQK